MLSVDLQRVHCRTSSGLITRRIATVRVLSFSYMFAACKHLQRLVHMQLDDFGRCYTLVVSFLGDRHQHCHIGFLGSSGPVFRDPASFCFFECRSFFEHQRSSFFEPSFDSRVRSSSAVVAMFLGRDVDLTREVAARCVRHALVRSHWFVLLLHAITLAKRGAC